MGQFFRINRPQQHHGAQALGNAGNIAQNFGSASGKRPEVSEEQHNHKQRLEIKLRRELGDQILSLLTDDRVEDICLNPDSALWVQRRGEGFVQVGEMAPAHALTAMSTIAAWRGTVINYERPILETELPIDGSRFEGIVPPVVRRPVFAIRLRPRRVFTLEEYSRAEILTEKGDQRNRLGARDEFKGRIRGLRHEEIIRAAILARKNILVVGSTGSGKTTLVNACLNALATLAPNDRVISIEDTIELQCKVANYLDLRAVGKVEMLDCLKACMRLIPHRIIVGEVRGPEALALLKAWNTGHPGGLATIHADDAIQGLSRLEGLISEATHAPSELVIGRLVGEAIHLVVFIDRDVDLGRKVREVLLVDGYADGVYQVEYV
jgi:type IV secretion system protein VirB11